MLVKNKIVPSGVPLPDTRSGQQCVRVVADLDSGEQLTSQS